MTTTEIIRCPWGATTDTLMREYHDKIWGKFASDDRELFECLCLEVFQAGLSWRTVINKKPAFEKAFANFDIQTVANFKDENIDELLTNPEIIRNHLKIKAAINNANIVLDIQKKYGSFNAYLLKKWPDIIVNEPKGRADVIGVSPASTELSKQMKKDGFKFLGPAIVYAFLQATGRINDHITTCSFKFN